MRRLSLVLALLLSLSTQAQQHGWLVTSDADAGPNTLRAAIEEANALCTSPQTSCVIDFFVHPEALPRRIEVRSALPPLLACNLLVRSVRRPPDLSDMPWTLAGNNVDAEGLVLLPRCEGSRIEIDGLAINSFGRDAIAIPAPVEARYVLNRLQIHNIGSRGIAVDSTRADVAIDNSSIGGTRRSGMTIWAAKKTELQNVSIGTPGLELFDIGASGLFLGPNAGEVLVRRSEIARARHFGLALAQGNAIIRLENTRIHHNAMAIDWGLDGPSPNGFGDNIPDTPRILSATFDQTTGNTRVVIDPQGAAPARIELWASHELTNTGTSSLDQFVGGADVTDGGPVTIESHVELRGLFLSAMRVELTRVSELTAAVQVR